MERNHQAPDTNLISMRFCTDQLKGALEAVNSNRWEHSLAHARICAHVQLKQQRELTPVVFKGFKSVAKKNCIADVEKKHSKGLLNKRVLIRTLIQFSTLGAERNTSLCRAIASSNNGNSVTHSKES